MKSSVSLYVLATCLAAITAAQCGLADAGAALNFNSVVDRVVAAIRQNVSAYKLNPYHINDVNETFDFAQQHGRLYSYHGRLHGIESLYRKGDAEVASQDGLATVTASLGFRELTYALDFRADVGDLGGPGKVRGDIRLLNVDIALLADVSNSSDVTAALRSFRPSGEWEVTFDFEDTPMATKLLEALVYPITAHVKVTLSDVLGHEVADIANSTIRQLRVDMSRP
ncbi:uncharacterized protein LOC134536247 [Bacillus rossius redtenbacheri]|uniref:uncharacterized protein LOC134536247 n=1 Tax=Bacillus rossius redtenbacheri TaxID=93214 RepID=UPI002FDCC1DD